MKVLHLNSVYKIGSTGRIVSNIHTELIKLNLSSYVCYGRGEDSQEDFVFKISSNKDNFLHGIGSRIFDNHGLYSKRSTKKLLDIINKVNPDIVHIHNIHGYYMNYLTFFNEIKNLNIKIVWTLHDCWAFTGHCSHFDYIGCNKWKYECSKCPQKKEYPKSVLFDDSKRNYNLKKNLYSDLKDITIVTPSNWLRKKVKQSILKESNVITINNGIDIAKFQRKYDSGLKEKLSLKNSFVMLSVASIWTEKKGINNIIEFSKNLKKDETLIIVGKISKKISLPNNIIHIESTNNIEELAQIYSISNVLLNFTLEDTFPTVNIESIACGTPVITYDSGGSKEIIDEQTGFVVKKGDFKSVREAINTIKSSKEKYILACVERAKQCYSNEEKIKEYIDLYKKVLNNE